LRTTSVCQKSVPACDFVPGREFAGKWSWSLHAVLRQPLLSGESAMPAHQSVKCCFSPEQIEDMHAAYVVVCKRLRIRLDAGNMAAERVALTIVDIARSGECNTKRLIDQAISEIGSKQAGPECRNGKSGGAD
jgi:hypothetical protein